MLNNNFSEDLNEFFITRQEGINEKAISGRYNEAVREVSKLTAQLKAILKTEEYWKVLNQLLDYTCTLETEATDLAYKRGFSDGVKVVMFAVTEGA